jgi:parallel beta-helix repeat protein
MEMPAMERKHVGRILLSSALITALAAALAGARPVAASRAFLVTPVSACRTISAPGTYFLTKSIGTPGNCIIIRASNVIFGLNSFGVVGNGSVGLGIVIVHGVTNVQVMNGHVNSWAVGIDDLGTDTHLQNLRVFNNTHMGIVLAGATNSVVQNDSFPGNGRISLFVDATTGAAVNGNSITGSGKYGIWVKNSSRFAVNGNGVSQSGIAGIFVGCSQAGILNHLTCPRSTSGTITGNRVVYDRLGIAIDRGNMHIHVMNNHVSAGAKFDLYDANFNCGTDTWSGDVFATHYPASCAM